LTGAPLTNNGYLYRAVISGTCSPGATSNAALLTIQQDVVINTAPQPSTICEGGTTQFTVSAIGTGLTYQWRENGSNITDGGVYSGATTATLILTGVTSAFNTKQYDVVITGTCSNVTSTPVAVLTVREKPEVTSHPSASVICEGSNTTFTVNAGVTTSPAYQWQVSINGGASYSDVTDGGIYSGATTATLALTGASLANNGYLYRAVISGACSPDAISNGAVLTINANPVISMQPSNAVVCEDGITQFTVSATGTGLTYQWRENGSNISNGGVYSGATTSTLTLTGVTSALNTRAYDVVITGTCSNVTSTPVAVLTVHEKPEVTSHPSASVICEGSNTTFTVNAGVTTSPAYQWQVSTDGGASYSNVIDGGIYGGATTATLSLTAAPLTNNGYLYRAVISGTCSPNATSNGALLTIQQNVVISIQPQPSTICENGTTQFTVSAVGTGLTYQWRENGSNITNGGVYSGATTATLTLTNVPSTFNTRQYDVLITGTCSNLPSAAATLTVNRNPDAVAADAAICSGQTTNITITNPNAVAGTTFTWSVQSATNVSGAAAGTGALIAQALTSTDGVSQGTVTYLIQATASGCNGVPFAVNVVVRPIPDVAASDQGICSGTSTSVALTNPNGVAGTTFSWIVQSSSNVTGASAGSGNVISQLLSAADGITPGTVTYRITPSANGCAGNFIDVTVTVNPKPVMTNSPTSLIQEICSATPLNFIPTASVSGTTFSWTSTVIGTLTGVSASGTGPITDTPVNATNSNAVIIYTITPAAGACNGLPTNLVVTVRPVPTAFANPQTICSGQTTSVALSNPNTVTGTTFTWTIFSTTNVSGASAGSGSLISQALTSTDQVTTGTVIYSVVAWANGCPGPAYNVSVTVNPVPVITNDPTTLSQQLCSGQALSFLPSSTIGSTTYTWTSTILGPINAASVTASGSSTITDAPINTGNVSGTVTYRITPADNGCNGQPVDLVVLVKPLPSATAPSITICSGSNAVVTISDTPVSVSGTTFSWTATPSANVAGSSNGNGSVISQLLTTTDALVGSVDYTITPSANGCNGPVTTITVTVNPIATIDAGSDFQVCEAVTMPMPVPVTGTIGGSALSGTWFIKSGSGSLSASTTASGSVTATYTAVNADVTTGFVELYLVTNDPDGAGQPCTAQADTIKISINRRPRIIPLADQVVCEPAQINLLGTLAGSATTGSWSSITTAGGTLSVSSITGTNVTATYDTLSADVGTVLTFRLTSNDPDGSGPCLVATDDMTVQINESAKVNAGADFEVCEDKPVQLNGSFSGTTSVVTWSGAGGPSQFTDTGVNDPQPVYNLTQPDIDGGFITLTIKTDDPDGAGPCTISSDDVTIKINKLPDVFFFGLDPAYAENSGIELLSPVPAMNPGGVFTGPGIIAGTNQFNPGNAGFGTIYIRYTYTHPVTGCVNYTEQSTIVNPVTEVDFYILEDNRPDINGFPQICADQGDLTLVGIPDVDEGFDQTLFEALSPELVPRLKVIGGKYKIDTNGLLADTYSLRYIFTNEVGATDTLTKDLIVFAAPQAVIDVTNNCIDDVVRFEESSYIPDPQNVNGVITNWAWLYGEGSNGSSSTTIAEPSYQYLAPGDKVVSLEVTTNEGCKHKVFKDIIIGTPPVPDFDWASFCQGDVTKFFDRSTSSFGTIDSVAWDFGDGDTLGMGWTTNSIPPGKHGGRTTGIWKDPKHKYSAFQVYDVTLTVATDSKCSADTTRQIFILETPVSADSYFTNFESGPGSWVAIGDPVGQSSWLFGEPYGEVINKAASGTNAWWTGGNDTSYFNNEQSYVIGPCLDLSGITRPMVSLNYQVDAKEGFDGAVFQFSTDGGLNWRTVGNAEDEGINWYNKRDMVAHPGGEDSYAWSEADAVEVDIMKGWRNARFNLEQINPADRDTVVFRIAFASSLDPFPGRTLNGFAFDDVYIGEKKRNVLVEHYTNDSNTQSELADQYLDALHSMDFIKLQYHVAAPGFDQINEDNPFDVSARQLVYGVSNPPVTIMDGILGNYYNKNFTGFIADITRQSLDRRSLEDPSFDIDLTFNPSADDVLSADITYSYNDTVTSYTPQIILQAALVETGVNGNTNSLRKLLLGPEGYVINAPLTAGVPQDFLQSVNYPIDVPIEEGGNLYVIAFVQERITVAGITSKRILQSQIFNAPYKVRQPPVGLPDDPVIVEAHSIDIYPNPASQQINFKLGGKLSRSYQWKIIDQRGVTVLEGDMQRDLTEAQQVDITRLANGIYFLAIEGEGKVLRYEKIAVMNQH
jgi:hypothetical protein